MTLAELLPKGMRDQLLWKYDDFEDYEAFKLHVLGKAEELEYLDREARRHPGAHVVDFDAIPPEEEEQEDEDKTNFQGEINAIMAKYGVTRGPGGKLTRQNGRFNGGGGARPGAPSPKAKASPARKARCINCGGQHQTSECRKERVSKEMQPCWTCGKPGHPSMKCPDRNRKAGVPRRAWTTTTRRMTGCVA